jgi:hypothetical protein
VTELEWRECCDPRPLFRWLGGRADDRKARLFGCHCCRRVWSQLGREHRLAVRASERFADGRLSDAAWWRAGAGLPPARTAAEEAAWAAWRGYGVAAARRAADAAEWAAPPARGLATWAAERAWQAALLRELCGGPSRGRRPVDPAVLAWNDGTVRRIALHVYEQGEFGCLPILHDALLDAGCGDEELLGHLRAEGPHVRGCWALDLLLGRS